MAALTGPDSALVQYRPVIEIADSKKFDEGIVLKTAGSNGSTEFTLDEIATIHAYIGDFLTMKGVNPTLQRQAADILRTGSGYLGDSLRDGESMSINGVRIN